MYTGIIKGLGTVIAVTARPGLVTLDIGLPDGCREDIEHGASISVDGVCLTVTNQLEGVVKFDVMQETLAKTTLGELVVGSLVNIERSSRSGAEVGGHLISGHIDCTAKVIKIEHPENNYVIHFEVERVWLKYIFAKGFIAINGASLTVAKIDDKSSSFTVWLIPETLRLTNFGQKRAGDRVNIEIDRNTQVIVDTVWRFMRENNLASPHPEFA